MRVCFSAPPLLDREKSVRTEFVCKTCISVQERGRRGVRNSEEFSQKAL